MRVILDRFQPPTAKEETEAEMTQRDEYGTIIMDDEDAMVADFEMKIEELKQTIVKQHQEINKLRWEIAFLNLEGKHRGL
jgi:hypothetical protein